MSEAATYASPTTPGLMLPFRKYIVELVCLNMRRPLKPRFWADDPYWAKKFVRECRGFAKFAKLHEERLDDPVFQQAVIAAIRWVQPCTLLNEHNLTRLDKRVAVEHARLLKQAENLAVRAADRPADQDHDEYMRRNKPLAKVGERTRFSRIRGIEGGHVQAEADRATEGIGGV